MIDIDVKIDAHEVMDSLTGLQQDVVPEAAKLALNRAVKQVRTAGVRKISKKLNLPSKFVRKRLAHGRFDRASNKVLRAKVYLIAYDVNAIEFKGIITKSGSVAERIKMQSGWKPKKTASGNTSTGDNVRKTENRIGSRRVKKSGGVRKRTYAHVGGRRIKKGAKLPDGRDFKKAWQYFQATQKLLPGDRVSELYVERCGIYAKTPPAPDWDGQEIITEK